MAGLISTGIKGFICSAKETGKQIKNAAGELIPEWISTFVSGVSGWIIRNSGDAEFKSVYVRDKIVTNEFVHNRIRVTEDEEIVSSNGKIESYIDNEDGTCTVYLDLREGDINPFADGDLIMGYYHNPENSGVIYAVQKMTVMADPDKDDGSMIVSCEPGCIPYRYMIIVRVGNLFNEERQSFIKISSRTNCQYFFDGIYSFAALDDPEHIKCAIGKPDIGLIPAWAAEITGSIRKWFGLIADGVILRGTFILKASGTTIEEELDGVAKRFVDVETEFEIREGQISSKVTASEKYAEDAADSAAGAELSAKNAQSSKETAIEKASEARQTAEGFNQTVTEKTQVVINYANDAKKSAEAAAGSAEAAEASKKITVEKASEAKQTAEGFNQTVTEKTQVVINYANDAKKNAEAAAGSAETAEASKKITVEKASEAKQTAEGFNQTVTEKTQAVINYANDAKKNASAAAGSAEAAEASKKITVEKASEVKQTAEGFQTTVTEVAKKAVQDAVAGSDSVIEEKVTSKVSQSARSWKVEILNGSDSVLAAINADSSGVKIKGDKIQITGELLATIIKTYGLNVNDSFIVDKIGRVIVYGEFHTGKTGPRVSITRSDSGPSLYMYANNSAPLIDMGASIDSDGYPDIRIKMLDAKNLNKWAEYGVGNCTLVERLADATQYETVIEAGRIRMYKNGIEIWNTNKR